MKRPGSPGAALHIGGVIRWGFLLLVPANLPAQSLEMTPATVTRGSAGAIRIVFRPRADRPVASLQWSLVYPDVLRIEPEEVVSGSVSVSVNKSLTCAPRPRQNKDRVLMCILAGGIQPLAEGTIAVVRFVATPEAHKGEVSARLEKVAAASPATDPIPIANASAAITIR